MTPAVLMVLKASVAGAPEVQSLSEARPEELRKVRRTRETAKVSVRSTSGASGAYLDSAIRRAATEQEIPSLQDAR
jgi:hypothetical protein